MFAERFSGLRNWLNQERDRLKEFKRFNEFFTGTEDPNGVLTKAGEEIHPLRRGLMTASGSFALMKKIVEGKTLSEKERERVRKAAWLTSLSGNYTLEPLPEGGVRVGITLESNEASSYLSSNANANNMVAFLSYRDTNNYRHKESSSINTAQEENNSHIIFDFPQVHEVPTINTQLFIYSQLHDAKNTNRRFCKLKLLLGIPKIVGSE